MVPCAPPLARVASSTRSRGRSGRQDEVDQLRETLDPIAGGLKAETTVQGLVERRKWF